MICVTTVTEECVPGVKQNPEVSINNGKLVFAFANFPARKQDGNLIGGFSPLLVSTNGTFNVKSVEVNVVSSGLRGVPPNILNFSLSENDPAGFTGIYGESTRIGDTEVLNSTLVFPSPQPFEVLSCAFAAQDYHTEIYFINGSVTVELA